MPIPISSFVFKVASRCNLDCTYCYEYNMGDDSWKSMPKAMSLEVVKAATKQILNHCKAYDFNNIDISLHGGEPLVIGLAQLKAIITELRAELGSECRLSLGLQTNGTLLSSAMLRMLEEEEVSIGVSFDGPALTNDLARVYADGSGSSTEVVRALELLRSSPSFAGILSVIQISSDPVEVWDYLSSFDPPSIDFLLPHGHWDLFPPLKTADNALYGKWLIAIFDAWFAGAKSTIRIRMFEEIIVRLLGGKGSLESIGLEPVALSVIASDGTYESVDTMKSVFPKAHILGLNVFEHSLDDVLAHPSIAARQSGINALSSTCKQCSLVQICGGGYLPHRYSKSNGFINPSVYCNDLTVLIQHIHGAVQSESRSGQALQAKV